MSELQGRYRSVVLAAHGAGDDSPANQEVRAITSRLRGRDAGASFEPVFNRGSPSFATGSADADARTLVIPLMTSDGYFVRERIARTFGARRAAVAPPIGLLPVLREAFIERVVRQHAERGFAKVLIVGHGTQRHPASAGSTETLAAELRQRISVPIRTAYLDQPPTLESVIADLLEERLLVLPFLLGGGTHELDDIPRMLREKLRGDATIVAPVISDERIDEWVLDLVGMSRRRFPLAIGTRGSRLALWQANHVADELAAAGVPSSIVTIETRGDLEKERPLDQFETDGPFTDALEEALSTGRIDLAVHSLKDLPLRATPLEAIAAVTPRGSAEEALVSRDGRPLHDLPFGATVGTSSSRRAWQLKALRKDLAPRPIRGNVEERVEQVAAGRFDAAILAAAGLERLGLAPAMVQRWPVDAFVPQAGQGIIAVQARRDDWFAESLCGRIDHPPTRLAALAELSFAREIECFGHIAAAAAFSDGDHIRLHARSIDHVHGAIRDCTVSGHDAHQMGLDAARRLHSRAGASCRGA